MEPVQQWIDDSPYSAFLGVRLEEISETRAVLRLPYQDPNSNPGGVLHGGCAASLGAMGGQAITRFALGPDSGPWHTAQMQVNYLAAAVKEDVVAEATLSRRGKEICFVSVHVRTDEGKPIALINTTVRGLLGAEPARPALASGDHGESEPGPMGPHIGKVPFIGNRQIQVEHMTGGTSRLTMPAGPNNNDVTGAPHEGAILALLDTTGAMGSWAESGPGPYKASTASMQLQMLAPAEHGDLVAYGQCVQRDGAFFWTDVDVANAASQKVVARGTVLYRILT